MSESETERPICAICTEQVIDEIRMTCEAEHPFCFKCILKDISTNNSLKPCPLCKNGSKYIMIPYKKHLSNTDIEPFYTIKYFKECLPILNKIVQNPIKSCLISEYTLLLYIKNKRQITLVKQQHSVDEVFDLIKWVRPPNNAPVSSNIPVSFFTRFTENFNDQTQQPAQQPAQQPVQQDIEFNPENIGNYLANEIFNQFMYGHRR